MKYYVIAPALNLRSTPNSSRSTNILARIPQNNLVELIDKHSINWWKVKILSNQIVGYVASRFLEPFHQNAISLNSIGEANFAPDSRASLDSKRYMHKPIGDSSIPYRDLTSLDTKLNSIQALHKKLHVENSIRYKRTEKHTFCNIYAYDFCHFSQAYLPRVWWKERAIRKLLQQESVEVLYGETVYEMNANALHDWLINWGDQFGWFRETDLTLFQQFLNDNGGIGIICAKRKDRRRSGHITVALPENDQAKAYYENGKVLFPLQTQAGATNLKYFSVERRDWWSHDRYSSFVFFLHG